MNSEVTNSTPMSAMFDTGVAAPKRSSGELVNDYLKTLQTSKQAAAEAPANVTETTADLKPAMEETVKTQDEVGDTSPASAADYIEVAGKRIDIDFSDREKLKKELKARYDFERGFRKMQVERDTHKTELKGMQEKLQKLESNWEAMDKAYQEQGEEGLIDLLRGKSGAYREWLKEQLDKQDFLRTASPSEREALEAREREAKYLRDLERERESNRKFRESMERQKEEVDVRTVQTAFDSAAERHGFHGKLGSPEDEDFLDDMLFNQVKTNLASIESSNLSPEVIRKEFATVAAKLRKRIGAQTEKSVTKVLEAKKQAAAESMQSAIKNSTDPSARSREEAMDHLKSGSISKLMAGWGKYKSYF